MKEKNNEIEEFSKTDAGDKLGIKEDMPLSDDQASELRLYLNKLFKINSWFYAGIIFGVVFSLAVRIIKIYDYFSLDWLKYIFGSVALFDLVLIIVLSVLLFKQKKKIKAFVQNIENGLKLDDSNLQN